MTFIIHIQRSPLLDDLTNPTKPLQRSPLLEDEETLLSPMTLCYDPPFDRTFREGFREETYDEEYTNKRFSEFKFCNLPFYLLPSPLKPKNRDLNAQIVYYFQNCPIFQHSAPIYLTPCFTDSTPHVAPIPDYTTLMRLCGEGDANALDSFLSVNPESLQRNGNAYLGVMADMKHNSMRVTSAVSAPKNLLCVMW